MEKAVSAGGDVRRHLPALAAVAPLPRPLGTESARKVEYVTEPGGYHLARELASATGLNDTLKAAFGHETAQQLLFLASYQLLEATTSMMSFVKP